MLRCNGIVCYTKLYQNRKDRGLIYLWNPFVRKLKVLPKFREKCYSGEAKKAIGFWFDKEKNDYEVARISYAEVASSVDFFSLRSNSWKTISDSCTGVHLCPILEHNVVYTKGTLLWLAEERSRHWKTVSINLNIGMFQEALIGPEVGSSGPDGMLKTFLECSGPEARCSGPEVLKSFVLFRASGLCSGPELETNC
ncbi:F-box/kelch-repeat protein At3g23880-like [Apium graveolens]|uniref:F-box/kelch-repeat protein At3g23880-like n=1 Tax=Apium graveolens TaxID=4045 RepID=UPI003D7A129E